MALRAQIATRPRGLAQLLDGREFMNARWHKASVAQMNAYIERTEDELERLRGYGKDGEPFLKINFISRKLLQHALDQVEQLQAKLDGEQTQTELRWLHQRLRFVLTGKEQP